MRAMKKAHGVKNNGGSSHAPWRGLFALSAPLRYLGLLVFVGSRSDEVSLNRRFRHHPL